MRCHQSPFIQKSPAMQENLLTKEDQEFLEKIHTILTKFVESEEAMLEMQPMNSYQRRLVHKTVTDFKLKSTSVGEEERFVCVTRTSEATVPEMKFKTPQSRHDFGSQTFFAAANTRIVLRPDGSFGVPLASERYAPVDERMVENAFRIRNSKIVCDGEEGW